MPKKVDTLEDLFGWNKPHPTAQTSRIAFENARAKSGDRLRAILRYLDQCGESGATMDQTCVALNILTQSACGLFRQLVRSHQIEDSGARRKTRTDNWARVYRRRDKSKDKFPHPSQTLVSVETSA